MSKKALIAMSGGVDSSVAAKLMVDAGFECVGITMKLHNNEDIYKDHEKACCSEKDIEDAKSVSANLGMEHHVFNFTDDFDRQVINRFIECYENGTTPNPCIDCNRHIKFKRLFQRAEEMGMDYIVTGHYARVEYDEKSNRYLLKKALDDTKDQSYVLYSLTQKQLEHTMFPLGSLTKTEARKIAEESGFINSDKADSQDICFVPDGDYAKFIEQYTGKTFPPGDFVDKDGNKLGTHNGIIRYTIGQRKGLGLSLGRPIFVCSKCTKTNTVVLGDEEELFSKELDATDVNLISCDKITGELKVKARTRYNQVEQDATVTQKPNGDIHVVFDKAQRAFAPGQAVVLYDGDVVVGGGTII